MSHLEGSYPLARELKTLGGLGQEWLYVDHGSRVLELSTHCNTEVTRWSLRECGINGAWFTATAGLDREGRRTFDFDHDNEPQFSFSISVGHYLEEWEKFPRDEVHTPPWLAECLARAREWEETPE